MKVLPDVTFLIVAPLLFIVLVGSVLVRPSGLFLLLQCFLLGPGPLPLLHLFFLLLGKSCFLLCCLEGRDTTRHWMWPLHEVHRLVTGEVSTPGGQPPPGDQEGWAGGVLSPTFSGP